MKLVAMIALALALGVTAAHANRCPKEMAAIDKALPTVKLTPEQVKQVRQLRSDGEKFHKAGDHKQAEAALDKAKAILKIK